MRSDIRVCSAWHDRHDHPVYLPSEIYPECGVATENNTPAPHNSEDPHGEYHRTRKRRLAEEPE